MSREWESWKKTPTKNWRTGKMITRPSLSKRSVDALRQFELVGDVSLRALWMQKGVGRKTIREIVEAFAEHGYPALAEERAALNTSTNVYSDRAYSLTKVTAADRRTAERAVVEAAVAYVETGDDAPLRNAVEILGATRKKGKEQ